MFLYSANGITNGATSLTNKEFFKRAANELTALLSAYTPEGMCYRVDLRLRPEGSLGEVCTSLAGARTYYESRARDWELQMMIKARVAAGDRPTGAALLDFVEPKIYSTTLDFSAIESLSVTRERINEKLARKKRTRGTRELDIKVDRGGIRDIEFLVQCLQRLYGGADLWVRHGGTLLAIARLQNKGFLSDAEQGGLTSAYQFLRHLEHRLQFADDRQTHALPSDPAALERIARRMPLGGGSAQWLLTEIKLHFAQVVEIYERVVHASVGSIPETSGPQSSNVVRALEQTAPTLSRSLAVAELHHGYRAFEHFLEKLSADEARLERLNQDQALTARTLDLFEQSPYFAEELIRSPELIDVLAGPAEQSLPNDAPQLRRWYRREMLRIQTASICESQPIFETLERTSALADTVIARAYEIAVADIWGESPPEKKLWVIALGRLGMREFDLASDADLVFVLCDSESRRMEAWTRVANRLIDLVTAYTGDGVLFAVDTRLRPNGGDGPLVQTESAVKDYFTRTAEAWEGITYMKSRAVAGETSQRRSLSPPSASHRLGALRAKRAFAHRPQANAPAFGKGAGRDPSPESRPRRLLRHRFSADVPAPEKRRHFLPVPKHTGAYRGPRKHGSPGPQRSRLPARRRHVLSRPGPRPARPLRPRGRKIAGRRATGGARNLDQALDLSPSRGANQHPRPHPRTSLDRLYSDNSLRALRLCVKCFCFALTTPLPPTTPSTEHAPTC